MLDLNFAKAANRCRCEEKTSVRDAVTQGSCRTWTDAGLRDAAGSIHLPDLASAHLLHHGMQSYRRKAEFPKHHVQDLAVP